MKDKGRKTRFTLQEEKKLNAPQLEIHSRISEQLVNGNMLSAIATGLLAKAHVHIRPCGKTPSRHNVLGRKHGMNKKAQKKGAM